jgi:uncharacterized membrane protein YfcA
MILDSFILFFAGLLGGILNSIAGGGSFITFPALLFAGVPPIAANATNTFASCAGYLSGAYAFRKDIATDKNSLKKIIIPSLFGGLLGALLLLNTPETVFKEAIPWLLLFATLLFIFGSKLNKLLVKVGGKHKHANVIGSILLALLLLIICIYGGFFNAGLGIVSLSYLVLARYQDINLMNGIKLLISSIVSLIAIVIFIANGTIYWFSGFFVLLGTLSGGYFAAKLSRTLSQAHIRMFVTVASLFITVYFFYDTYGLPAAMIDNS